MFRGKKKEEEDEDLDMMGQHEQLEYIKRMKRNNNQQNKFHKNIFVIFCLVFIMAKLYGCVSQLVFPYNMFMYWYLYAMASTPTIIISEIISALCYGLNLYYIQGPFDEFLEEDELTIDLSKDKRRIALIIAGVVGLIQCLLWHFFIGPPYVHSFWFGGGNFVFSIMVWFVRKSMEETDESIIGLMKHVSPHKTV